MSSADDAGAAGFAVHLAVFSGPFDLLLQLIAKHRLDVTEVALSQVTDEFIAHLTGTPGYDLDQASGFLVVAATLLDLKAARLLPRGEVDDEDDLALLEARDLLFARLLQYRAYKRAAGWAAERMEQTAGRYPRSVALEPRYASALPEVVLGLGPAGLAALAARAMAPRPARPVPVDHLHAPRVDMRAQLALVAERLASSGTLSFRALSAGADLLETVARFLVLLDLYREGAVAFAQVDPLGELRVRWLGGAGAQALLAGQHLLDDEQAGHPAAASSAGAAGPPARTGEDHR